MSAFDFPATPTDGQVYTANGVTFVWSAADTAWKGQGSQVPLTNKMRVIAFSGAGTYAYVKPSNLKAIEIEIFGAGGGGGGCAATAATTMAAAGGGAAGGYVKKLYQASELAASENLVLGAGGAGGVGQTVGSTGTTSTFKGLTAPSGTGGGVQTPGTTVGGASGRGSPGAGTGGDVNGGGDSGEYGVRFAHGSTNTVQTGYGGPPFTERSFHAVPTTSTNDFGGQKAAPGCGGNGSSNALNQATAKNGADGGDAFAIITEYYFENDTVPGQTPIVYEEWGDWTPAFVIGTSTGSAGIVHVSQFGRWRKQGKLVTLWFDVLLSSKGALVGAVYITGSPFQAANTGASQAGTISYYRDLVQGVVAGLGCYMGNNSALLSISGAFIATPQQTALQNSTLTNTTRMMGSVTYEAAS